MMGVQEAIEKRVLELTRSVLNTPNIVIHEQADKPMVINLRVQVRRETVKALADERRKEEAEWKD